MIPSAATTPGAEALGSCGHRLTRLFVLLSLTAVFCPDLSPRTLGDDRQSLAVPESDDGLPGSGPIRRADWFRNLWLQRRTQWQKTVARDRNAVVFLGDSITQGWNQRLSPSFPGVRCINRGISGDTSRGVLVRLEKDVIATNPAAVVLLIGTNDLEENASPETVVSNIGLIIERLRERNPKLPIVINLVMPSSAQKNRPADAIREINRGIGVLTRDDRLTTVLDVWTLFADENGDARPEEFPDLLHPNDAGYAMWSAALRPILATLGFGESDGDEFQPEDEFVSLFNGRDLSGWCFLPTSEAMRRAAARWQERDPTAPPWPIVEEIQPFHEKTETPDGRYKAVSGRLVVTTPSEGRRIQQLWTTEEFGENFTLRLQFRATPNADSGLFIRQPQLQVRDYVLAGPYRNLNSYRPQDWNDLEITVRGTSARCTCNGELLEAEFTVPESGPIGLEGDRGQVEYRRIRIRRDN